MEAYDKLELLGKGTQAVVYKVRRKEDGKLFALKTQIGLSVEDEERVETEVRILKALQSATPHVVSYEGVFGDSEAVHLVMEYADGGTLDQIIKQQKGLSNEVVLAMFSQLVLGLCEVHRLRCIHRDLKTANVLLTTNGELKISDFGVSRALLSTASFGSTLVGTPYYLAPEVCEGLPYCEEADIWSLGVILYEMCTSVRPFQSETLAGLVMKIVGDDVVYPETISPEVRQLLDRMLDRDLDKRISIFELANHPLLLRFIEDPQLSRSLVREVLCNSIQFKEDILGKSMDFGYQFVSAQKLGRYYTYSAASAKGELVTIKVAQNEEPFCPPISIQKEAAIIESLNGIASIPQFCEFVVKETHSGLVTRSSGGLLLDDSNCKLSVPVQSTSEFLSIAVDLCRSVDYLHTNWILHLGLSASTISFIPNRSGDGSHSLELVDFSDCVKVSRLNPFARVVSNRGLTSSDSPEVKRGTPVDFRADVFSIGAILYWLRTGIDQSSSTARNHVWNGRESSIQSNKSIKSMDSTTSSNDSISSPKRPSLLNISTGDASTFIFEAIDSILVKALREDPQSRHQSVRSLMHDLAWCLDNLNRPVGQRENPVPPSMRSQSPKLDVIFIPQTVVGREPELKICRLFLNAVYMGKGPKELRFIGAEGMGKSMLCDYATSELLLRGGMVWSFKSVATVTGSNTPHANQFGSVQNTLTNWMESMTAQQRELVSERVASLNDMHTVAVIQSLCPLFTLLTQSGQVTTKVSLSSLQNSEIAFAIVSLLGAISDSKQPFLVIFDDGDNSDGVCRAIMEKWNDPTIFSPELLKFVAFLVTETSDDPPTDPPTTSGSGQRTVDTASNNSSLQLSSERRPSISRRLSSSDSMVLASEACLWLRPWTEAVVESVVSNAMGLDWSDVGIVRDLTAYLMESTAGVPKKLVRELKRLHRRHILHLEGDRWKFESEAGAQLNQQDVNEVDVELGLTEERRHILHTAYCFFSLKPSANAQILAKCTRRHVQDCIKAFDDLVHQNYLIIDPTSVAPRVRDEGNGQLHESRLVQPTINCYTFTHDDLLKQVYQSIDPKTRGEIHATIAWECHDTYLKEHQLEPQLWFIREHLRLSGFLLEEEIPKYNMGELVELFASEKQTEPLFTLKPFEALPEPPTVHQLSEVLLLAAQHGPSSKFSSSCYRDSMRLLLSEDRWNASLRKQSLHLLLACIEYMALDGSACTNLLALEERVKSLCQCDSDVLRSLFLFTILPGAENTHDHVIQRFVEQCELVGINIDVEGLSSPTFLMSEIIELLKGNVKETLQSLPQLEDDLLADFFNYQCKFASVRGIEMGIYSGLSALILWHSLRCGKHEQLPRIATKFALSLVSTPPHQLRAMSVDYETILALATLPISQSLPQADLANHEFVLTMATSLKMRYEDLARPIRLSFQKSACFGLVGHCISYLGDLICLAIASSKSVRDVTLAVENAEKFVTQVGAEAPLHVKIGRPFVEHLMGRTKDPSSWDSPNVAGEIVKEACTSSLDMWLFAALRTLSHLVARQGWEGAVYLKRLQEYDSFRFHFFVPIALFAGCLAGYSYMWKAKRENRSPDQEVVDNLSALKMQLDEYRDFYQPKGVIAGYTKILEAEILAMEDNFDKSLESYDQGISELSEVAPLLACIALDRLSEHLQRAKVSSMCQIVDCFVSDSWLSHGVTWRWKEVTGPVANLTFRGAQSPASTLYSNP